MTKRDFAMIAGVIRAQGGRSMRPAALAHALADAIEQQDTLFDRDKFLIACGVRRRKPQRREPNAEG